MSIKTMMLRKLTEDELDQVAYEVGLSFDMEKIASKNIIFESFDTTLARQRFAGFNWPNWCFSEPDYNGDTYCVSEELVIRDGEFYTDIRFSKTTNKEKHKYTTGVYYSAGNIVLLSLNSRTEDNVRILESMIINVFPKHKQFKSKTFLYDTAETQPDSFINAFKYGDHWKELITYYNKNSSNMNTVWRFVP